MVLLVLVVLHVLALHEVGSNNPDGVDIKKHLDKDGKPLDGIPFHPHYTIGHDLPGVVLFLFVFCAVMFFYPDGGGYLIEHANYEPADPLKTPEHIAPVRCPI